MHLFALAAVLLTAATSPPQQFDLVCTGASNPQHNSAFEAVDIHLRVDLATKHWCEGSCVVVHDIAEVQPAALWLVRETEAEQEQHLMHWSSVDRQTGSYAAVHQFFVLQRKDTIALDSHCEPAPFSHFPKIETKF